MDLETKKFPPNAVDEVKDSLELDLISFFKIVNDKIITTLEDGVQQGKEPDEIINDIGIILQ